MKMNNYIEVGLRESRRSTERSTLDSLKQTRLTIIINMNSYGKHNKNEWTVKKYLFIDNN